MKIVSKRRYERLLIFPWFLQKINLTNNRLNRIKPLHVLSSILVYDLFISQKKFALRKSSVKNFVILYFLLFIVNNFHWFWQWGLIIYVFLILEKVVIAGLFERIYCSQNFWKLIETFFWASNLKKFLPLLRAIVTK